MANYFERKGVTVKDEAVIIGVTPGIEEISFIRGDLKITNNTDKDAFIKVAISNTENLEAQDWINGGEALFASTPSRSGIRVLDENGNPVSDTFYDLDEGQSDDRIVITDRATVEHSAMLMGPSSKIIVWANVSGVSVRFTALTQSKCGQAVINSGGQS